MSERQPFRPALVIGLITAGLISFAAFILLLGWGGGGGQEGGSEVEAPPQSAVGFKGLMEFTAKFVPVATVRREAEIDSYDLLVVPVRLSDGREDVEELLRRRKGRPTVVILPKWAVVRDSQRRGWVRALGPWRGGLADNLLGEQRDIVTLPATKPIPQTAAAYGPLEGIAIPVPRQPQLMKGARVEMLAGLIGEGALVARLGREPHYVVSDPDLFNNHGLRRPQAARAAVEMLTYLANDPEGRILFATGGAGVVAQPPRRNLLRSMFEPPFLPMTLALLVAALLAGLYGVGRFGPARRPARAIAFGKAALVENSAALVRLAGREVRLGGAYAELVRDEAARAGAAPPHLQGEALEAYLDRFSKPGEPSFRSLAWEVRQARDRPTFLAAARALFAWKKDMIR